MILRRKNANLRLLDKNRDGISATDFCKIGVPETKITGSVITFYEENFLTICTEIITVFPRMQSPQENKTNKGFQKIFYIYFRKENKTHEGFQKKFYFYFRKENKTT